MPIYRGPGGSSPLNDNVTVSEVAELTFRAENAAEAAEGSAAEAFQNAESANQSNINADQQRAFAQAAAQEASGYAVEAFESKQTAQQQAATATAQATQAIEAKDEAAASAASVDAANLARVDQANTFSGPQVVIPDPSDPTNDALLTLQADPDNTEERANPVLRLQQDGDLAQFHITMNNGTSAVVKSVNKVSVNNYNDIFFQQEDRDGAIITPLSLDRNQNVRVHRGVLQLPQGSIDTDSTTPLSLKVNGESKADIASDGVTVLNNFSVNQNTTLNGDLTVAGNIINDSLVQTETGTWIPRFFDLGDNEVGGGVVQRTGEYVKVGTQVTVYFRYNTTSSAAANLAISRLTGLPFPVKDTVDNFAVGKVQTVDIQFGTSEPHLIAVNGTSEANFRYNRSNAAPALPTTPSDGNAFTIRGSLTYQTN